MCTFAATEIAQYYLNNASDVYLLLLDASKAFDRVEYVKLLYPRREAGILWIHHRRRPRPRPRPRPQRFLVSDLQSTFLSGFLSYLAGGLIW